MIATRTNLPMYDFPEAAAAHDRLWQAIVAHARTAGVDPALGFTQVCAYPLLRSLSDRFEALAVPGYAFAWCEAALHRAVIVVGVGSTYAHVEALRGTRFAMNAADSNTGMNLPRRLFAPYARAGGFFAEVVQTGSHVASLAAVSTGAADAASIDAVTFGLLAALRPTAVAGVRIIAQTAPSPAPPFVVPRGTTPRDRARLLAAISAALADEQLADVRRVLGLVRCIPARPTLLTIVEDYEREAIELGYPVLA